MRAFGLVTLLALAMALPTAALAAEPEYGSVSLNDPAIDAEESAFVSGLCGVPIVADVSGRIGFVELDRDGAPGTFQLALFGIRITYVNPENGAVVRLRDVGPDRAYIRDGAAFVAVTGRSEGGTGIIGVVKIDLTTGQVVHEAGKDIGLAYDRICAALT